MTAIDEASRARSCRHGRQIGDDCGLCELQGPDRPEVEIGPSFLPCPFCGCENIHLSAWEGRVTVDCMSCGVEMPGSTTEEAIAAWNRRHPGDALRAGAMTLNEARAAQGLPPDPVDEESLPTLAEVQALAERSTAGDLDALQEYPDAARALIESLRPVTAEEVAERRRIWEDIVKLNESILESAPC